MQTMRWGDKRYHSVDYEWKKQFGEKVYKVALDGGMTCPNRDGTVGTGGCIFCSSNGSGEFASPQCESVTEQINRGIIGLSANKHVGHKFVAYFQSFTNTYAPVKHLEQIFTEAINHPKIVALSIATRPDCLPEDVLVLLEKLNQVKPVIVELGLQTSNEQTAQFIRRSYPLHVFDEAVKALHERMITTVAHLIIGLPGETLSDMLLSASHVVDAGIDGIKLHSLHVLKGTDLAKLVDTFTLPEKDEYVDDVVQILTHLPPEITVHRITGDPPSRQLIAPLWSTHKREVMNAINSRLAKENLWQGCNYSKS